MTRSNRVLNRLLLLVIALAALGAAVVVAAPFLPLQIVPWVGLVPAVPVIESRATLWALVAVAGVIVVLSLGWIATRGRGRVGSVYRHDGIVIDAEVLAQNLRESLWAQPDVLAVGVRAFRGRGDASLVRIEARPRADVPALLASIRAAVARADETLGVTLPLAVHVTTGARTRVARRRVTR